MKKKTGLSQRELYEKMSFGEEQLHLHVQGNPFNIPSAFVAYMILKVRGRKSITMLMLFTLLHRLRLLQLLMVRNVCIGEIH